MAVAIVVVFFASCNRKPAPEPEVVVRVDSETTFVQTLTTEQIDVAKAPTFYFKGVTGDKVNINPNNGVATVYQGDKTYQLSPPAGLVVKKVYYKPEGQKRDMIRVDGTIKVKNKAGKEVDKAVSYWVMSDCNRELGAYINKAGVLTDNKTDKAVKVSLTGTPTKVEKQIYKKDMKDTDEFVRDVPPPAKK